MGSRLLLRSLHIPCSRMSLNNDKCIITPKNMRYVKSKFGDKMSHRCGAA